MDVEKRPLFKLEEMCGMISKGIGVPMKEESKDIYVTDGLYTELCSDTSNNQGGQNELPYVDQGSFGDPYCAHANPESGHGEAESERSSGDGEKDAGFPYPQKTPVTAEPKRRGRRKKRTILESPNNPALPAVGSTFPTPKKKRNGTIRKYKDRFLAFGFACAGDAALPTPFCVICKKKLSNQSMVPTKLRRHLQTNHPLQLEKPLSYFQNLLSNGRGVEKFVSSINPDKMERASAAICELIARSCESYDIGEDLILPACRVIVETMLGPEAAEEVACIPLSSDSICARLCDLSTQIETTIRGKLTATDRFSLLVHETVDCRGESFLIGFVRFVDGDEFAEEFLFCRALAEDSTDVEAFLVVSAALGESGLSWDRCCGVCTDGFPAANDRVKGFVSHAKKINSALIESHCFLNAEALVSRTIGPGFQRVLDELGTLADRLRADPLRDPALEDLCQETHIPWLSRRQVLHRFLNSEEDLVRYFGADRFPTAQILVDKSWFRKLAYLADVFEHLARFLGSLEGEDETILSTTRKINEFLGKICSWKAAVETGDWSDFPSVARRRPGCDNPSTRTLAVEHLSALRHSIAQYLPSETIEGTDWVLNPFSSGEPDKGTLSEDAKIEVAYICKSRKLRKAFDNSSINSFWLKVKDCPLLRQRVVGILLPFAYPRLYHRALAVLGNTERNSRWRPSIGVERDLRVSLFDRK